MQKAIPDEATIIKNLHREDALAQQAFGWVIELHSKRLYTSVRRWVKNHEITNDILQEVFLKVWKNRQQFKGNSALFSWIYRIAYNETMQVIQKEKKHQSYPLDLPLVAFQHTSEHFGKITPEEISTWLFQAIETLPEKQRLVFEYKYFQELKYEEIAVLTGGTTGGLKANYFHAVAKIEAFLKSKLNH
jgi:RNA polymerase sigma-70 factor (ECF subfamily)